MNVMLRFFFHFCQAPPFSFTFFMKSSMPPRIASEIFINDNDVFPGSYTCADMMLCQVDLTIQLDNL